MVEFTPVGDNLYRRGFAGDTLNTCWRVAQLLGDRSRVAFLRRVGVDPYSSQFLEFVDSIGLDSSMISRDASRTIGLYVIGLTGAERCFTHWRAPSNRTNVAERTFKIVRRPSDGLKYGLSNQGAL